MGMPFHGWRWPVTRTAIVSSALLVSCVGSLPDVSPEADITVGTNLQASLTFRTAGDAPDAPPAGMGAAENTSRLGLAQALERAVLADADIQAALARVQIARADAEQARLLPNPVLDFVLRWGKQQNQIEVSVAQALLSVLQRPRKASAADARLRRAATEALVVGLDVANNLQRCYAEAQAADNISGLLAEQLHLLDRAVALADNRLKNGEGTQSERTSLLTQKLGTELRLAAARQRQHELRLQLARCIGEPSSQTDWDLDAWQQPEAIPGDERSWLRTALSRRPELQALRFELAALGDERALALWAPWQDAAIGANVQRAPTWVGGPVLTVPLPIFDRGEAAADRVTAEQAAVRHQLTGEMRRVIEDVRNAFGSYNTHHDNLRRVTEQLLPLHEQRQQQAEAALRLGMADASALLQVAQARLQARQTALELQRDTTLAWLRLTRATAGLAANPSNDDRKPPTNPLPNLPSNRGAAEER